MFATKSEESAGVAVLAGGDTAAYHDRLLAWTGDLRPRDDVEHYLVRIAVALSCAFDRSDGGRRSRLIGGATGSDPVPMADDATRGARPPSTGTDDLGEWLGRNQLTCVTALVGTLDALIRLRQLGGSGSPAAAASAEAPPSPAVPTAARYVSAAGLSDTVRTDEGQPPRSREPRAVLDVAGAEGQSGPERPSIRDRIVRRRHRQPGWPAPDGPASARPSAAGDKCDPAARSTREVEGSWSAGDARRCVGGYPVPLDQATPVSRADRVPIRLRRHESGVQYARASSGPFSSFPPAAHFGGREPSRRQPAQ